MENGETDGRAKEDLTMENAKTEKSIPVGIVPTTTPSRGAALVERLRALALDVALNRPAWAADIVATMTDAAAEIERLSRAEPCDPATIQLGNGPRCDQ